MALGESESVFQSPFTTFEGKLWFCIAENLERRVQSLKKKTHPQSKVILVGQPPVELQGRTFCMNEKG